MKSYFAYVSVSTARQGEEGVSLQEQKGAILEFALKRGMPIGGWFEERITRLLLVVKPRLAGLRESDSMDQDADLVGLLYKPTAATKKLIPPKMLTASQSIC